MQSQVDVTTYAARLRQKTTSAKFLLIILSFTTFRQPFPLPVASQQWLSRMCESIQMATCF